MQMTVGTYERVLRDGRSRLKELDRLIAEDPREIEIHLVQKARGSMPDRKRAPKSPHKKRSIPEKLDPTVEALITDACGQFETTRERFLHATKAAGRERDARTQVMRELRAQGWTTVQIGAQLGIHNSTVTYYTNRRA